jgi:hypothetical protein
MSKTELRNRDMSQQISFKQRWLADQFRKIRMVYSPDEFPTSEIKDMLLKEYDQRNVRVGRFVNNVDRTDSKMSVEQFVNTLMNRGDCCLSGYATLFTDSSHADNIALQALKFLLDARSQYKKEMVKNEKGSDKYVYYNTLQKDYKILANSYYGICSLTISPFFNPYVQNSITLTGQDIITTSISTMEAFLSNSNVFQDMDDLYEFAANVEAEKPAEPILGWLSSPVSPHEFESYIRSRFEDASAIDDAALSAFCANLSDESRSRMYYKNRISEFCATACMRNLISIFASGHATDPEALSEKINKTVCDYCLYDAILDDKFRRSLKQRRKSVLVVDTDSNFLYLGPQVKALMAISGSSGDDAKLAVTNMVIGIITEALRRIYWTLTSALAVPDDHKPIINMKNEFVYSRIMLTRNKKNYAGWLMYELGKPIPGDDPDTHLDVKGLAIRKSTVARELRGRFQNLLVSDILLPERISVRQVMKDFDSIGSTVRESLRSGKLEYATPKTLQTFSNYKNPERIDQLRGAIMWNDLEPENTIVPPESVSVLPLIPKGNKDCPQMLALKESNPKKYSIIVRRAYSVPPLSKKQLIDISSFGFDVLSVPKSQDSIPDYILPLIDYETLVTKAMANGNILLESLGIYCADITKPGSKINYKSNIVTF